LDLGYGPANYWNPTLRGWVARDLISDQPENEWIVLKPNVIETRAEAKERLKGTKAAMKKIETGRGKASDDVYILGDVRGPENVIGVMTKLYFSAV